MRCREDLVIIPHSNAIVFVHKSSSKYAAFLVARNRALKKMLFIVLQSNVGVPFHYITPNCILSNFKTKLTSSINPYNQYVSYIMNEISLSCGSPAPRYVTTDAFILKVVPCNILFLECNKLRVLQFCVEQMEYTL